MWTAAKLVAAILFAALAFYVSQLIRPLFPEGTNLGWVRRGECRDRLFLGLGDCGQRAGRAAGPRRQLWSDGDGGHDLLVSGHPFRRRDDREIHGCASMMARPRRVVAFFGLLVDHLFLMSTPDVLNRPFRRGCGGGLGDRSDGAKLPVTLPMFVDGPERPRPFCGCAGPGDARSSRPRGPAWGCSGPKGRSSRWSARRRGRCGRRPLRACSDQQTDPLAAFCSAVGGEPAADRDRQAAPRCRLSAGRRPTGCSGSLRPWDLRGWQSGREGQVMRLIGGGTGLGMRRSRRQRAWPAVADDGPPGPRRG